MRRLTLNEIIVILAITTIVILLGGIQLGIVMQNAHPPGVEPAIAKLYNNPGLIYSCQNEIWKNTTHDITIAEGSVGKSVSVENMYRVCYYKDGHTETTYVLAIGSIEDLTNFMHASNDNAPFSIPYVFKG
jgi:hypothetical protein